MFDCPEGIFSVVSRLAPLAFETFAELAAVNDGLNARAVQLPTWNGDLADDRGAFAAAGDVPGDRAFGGQRGAVGRVRMKPCLLTVTVILRIRIGTPLTIRGRVVVDDHLSGVLLDVDRGPRDHGPQVERPGDGRHRDREAEGSAVVGTGEVHGTGERERRRAGSGEHRGGADLARRSGTLPCEACGSGHCSTAGTAPASPFGSVGADLREVLVAFGPFEVEGEGRVVARRSRPRRTCSARARARAGSCSRRRTRALASALVPVSE